MNDLLCKIFNFVLRIFRNVVDFVAEVVKTVGSAAVGVLGELLEEVADTVFGGSGNLLLLLGAGLGIWLLLKNDDDSPTTQVIAAPATPADM